MKMLQQSIKDELSGESVKLKYQDGTIVTGTIGGRLSRFARVTWKQNGSFIGVEVAWETVAYCKTNNKPISI
jgi:hypothetical protein